MYVCMYDFIHIFLAQRTHLYLPRPQVYVFMYLSTAFMYCKYVCLLYESPALVFLLILVYQLLLGGNHEFGDSEQWLSYMMRYPTPHQGSGSTNFCYYGKVKTIFQSFFKMCIITRWPNYCQVVGVMHVISLCTYAGFNTTSLQYMWLENYLSSKVCMWFYNVYNTYRDFVFAFFVVDQSYGNPVVGDYHARSMVLLKHWPLDGRLSFPYYYYYY